MATGTATLGYSGQLQTYIAQKSAPQPTITVEAPHFLIISTVQLYLNSILGTALKFPPSGFYKLYLSLMNTLDTINLYSSTGKLLTTFTFTSTTYTLPKNTSVDRDYYITQKLGSDFAPSQYVSVIRIGLSQLLTLTDFVENGIIDCLLTLGPSESFVITSTGVEIHLNRTFTAGTELPIYRFTSVSSGSFQVTSSNVFVIPSDENATFFGTNQNIGDVVNVVNTTSTPTQVTLTMVIAGVGSELPLNTIGYPF